MNDRLELIQAVDADAVDDDAFEPAEELSDDENENGTSEDLTTESSSSKNQEGQPGRRAETKRVALTLAQKIAIIKHYEESKPMTIPKVMDWVMENFGGTLAKPPSTASISILLNKQRQKNLEIYSRAKQNDRVIRSKRPSRSSNEAQICCNVC